MTRYHSDEIYKILENEIVSLQIMPAEVLSENTLCERFRVSRTLVRSALQRLALAGFVEITPYVGTRVTAIELEAVYQFIYLRISAEVCVLRDFMRSATPPQIEELRFYKDKFAQAVREVGDLTLLDAEKTDSLLACDLEFHHCYFRFTDKEMVWKFLTRPHPDYSRFIRLDMLGGKNIPDVLSEHQALMDIIDSRDPAGVEERISEHLYGGTRRLAPRLLSKEFQAYIRSAAGK